MFARKVENGYQLFEDDGSDVLQYYGEAGRGIYPINNIDTEGGYCAKTGEPNLLGMNYQASYGEAFILSDDDFAILSSRINVEVE